MPRFPRTLTAGLELELVIQDVVAEPCATLLQDSWVFQVRLRLPAGLNPVLHTSDNCWYTVLTYKLAPPGLATRQQSDCSVLLLLWLILA